MAQHSGPGEPRRPRARRRRAGAGNRRTATAGAGTGSEMASGPVPGHLYWADGSSIWRANLDGTNPQPIVPNQVEALGVAVDASHLYWANRGDDTIHQASLDGTSPQAIVPGKEAFGLAVSP
jgi:hypothetical protein